MGSLFSECKRGSPEDHHVTVILRRLLQARQLPLRSMQGGKKGRGPKASARGGAPQSDPNKERWLYMLTCLHGHMVTVKMTNGQIWEGNFHACESEGASTWNRS
eukprot:Skav205087  [mRNA]  locus=scaffold2214:11326:15308:+ [translate_table: standard]